MELHLILLLVVECSTSPQSHNHINQNFTQQWIAILQPSSSAHVHHPLFVFFVIPWNQSETQLVNLIAISVT